jgi:hypothetical protein
VFKIIATNLMEEKGVLEEINILFKTQPDTINQLQRCLIKYSV